MNRLYRLEVKFRRKRLRHRDVRTSCLYAWHNGRVGVYPQTGALFHSTPKSASSTVHALLLYAEGLATLEQVRDPAFPTHDLLPFLGQAYWRQRSEVTPQEKKNLRRFGFVRNPWDRLLSFYADKIVRPDARFLDRYMQNYYPGVSFREMEFSDFAHFLQRLPEWRMEPHFLPQHYFFRPKSMDFIGRCENFAQDMERFASLLKPQAAKKIAEVGAPKLHPSEHRHYTEYYDEKTRRLVEKIYARDIKLFGYRFGD